MAADSALLGLRVLVTGGAGFVGTHLVNALIADGADVIVLDDLSNSNTDHLNSRAALINGSVTDEQKRGEALAGAEVVMHLAAIASVSLCEEKPELSALVNRDAAIELARQSREAGVSAFIFVSSAAIYGEPTIIPIDENHPQVPIGVYGSHKAEADDVILAMADSGLPLTVIRPFNIYGVGQDPASSYSGVLTIFSNRAKAGQPLTVFGDGEQTRDYIHVSDIVSSLCAVASSLVEKGEASPCHGRPFNSCSGHSTSLNQIITALGDALGKPLQVVNESPRQGDARESVGDGQALHSAIGWKSSVSLEDGLSQLLN